MVARRLNENFRSQLLTKGSYLGKKRPSKDTPSQSDFVRIFEVTTDRHAASDHGNLSGEVFNTFVDVKCGGVAFHGRTQRQDDFFNFALNMI